LSLLIVVILGIVEGLTEFLPVSSTGHLILTGHLLDFTGHKADTFEIFIQLGAILAVGWEFRRTLIDLARKASTDASAQRFLFNVGLAFLPAAFFGLLFASRIKAYLFSPFTVALALIGGGMVMYLLEVFLPERQPSPALEISWQRALGVGFAQVLALFPGVSRSASTIMGGMAIGLDRRAATEFSFYLALPTLGAATIYDLLKNLDYLDQTDVLPFSLGLVVSFISALVVIKVFLKYVRTHDFRHLAIYRIIVGALVLIVMN